MQTVLTTKTNNKENNMKTIEINGVKFLKHGLKYQGQYHPAAYSFGTLTDGREMVTIYAKSYLKGLPKIVNAENNSDGMVDYFEKDKIRFPKDSQEYNLLLQYK